MALELTTVSRQILSTNRKMPSIVVEFDGITELFTNASIVSVRRFDDTDLEFDDGWYLDTNYPNADEQPLLSFTGLGGTTTKIDAKIDPDLGIGEGVNSMQISIADDKKGTLISLFATYEFLARKVRIKVSPDSERSIYPNDYVTVFRGIVDEINFESGTILFNVSHPDQKKRQTIFVEGITKISGALDNSTTTITVIDTGDFLTGITGPDGNNDSAFSSYIRIDDEIIRYTGKTSTTFTGCTRGALGTTAATHDDEAEVKSFYTLEDNAIDLACKIMLSGWSGYFKTGVSVTTFSAGSNEIYFAAQDLVDLYGLTVGDYVTISGATNGSNNVSLKTIFSIEVDDEKNTTIILNDTTLVSEGSTSATASFRSRYDTLPSGLKMTPDEVDVDGHEYLRSSFLSTADMLFYLKETIDDAKDFINKEIYRPIAAYNVPRETKSSVGYTIPPLPTETPITVDTSNIKNPEKIRKKRQLGRSFYNAILYKFNEDTLENEFNSGLFTISAESKARIPIDAKVFTVESKGLRNANLCNSASNRRLSRYKFAASQIQNLKTTFGAGYATDVGDKIIVDGTSLKIPDESAGTKTSEARLYEILHKSLDLKTGDVTFTVLDTNFSLNNRYGLISPASYIASVANDKTFTIQQSHAWTTNEYKKWRDFVGASVRIRTVDYSSHATGVLKTVESDTIILENDLAITPSAGMIMEYSSYPDQGLVSVTTIYGHVSSGSAAFFDGKKAYLMI